MTQEDATVTLDELRALEAATTPGPWVVTPTESGEWGAEIVTIEGEVGIARPDDDSLIEPADAEADAAFIVAAVQYVRDALSVEGREEIEQQVKRVHSYCVNDCELDPDGVRRFRNNAYEDEECIDSIHDAADKLAALAGLRFRPSETLA